MIQLAGSMSPHNIGSIWHF